MKRTGIVKKYIAVCLLLGLIIMPVNRLNVHAEEIIATVEGTVLTGTTSEWLKFSTKEGLMEIKLDSNTDTSACKILLPDKKIYVSVSYNPAGYLYAVKITSDAQNSGVTLDASTTVTVKGTIGEKSKEDILYFNTDQGEMQIKLDTTTGMSGCSVLIAGKTYYISCARGSDAYMHAISISDTDSVSSIGTTAPNTNTGTTPANTTAANAATASVTGTVADRTKENLLYLTTSGGEMQFLIDSSADTSRGMVLTPGNKLTVSFYHGSDAYLHAVSIVGVKDGPSSAEIDTSSTATVKGTVENKSNENLLYLKTKQGTMEIKLDAVSSINNCKVLVSGKKLTVTCARGSDAYMHAISITGD